MSELFADQNFSVGFLFFLGLLFGSFSNVIIYRLLAGESFVRPRSRCPSCKKTIAWFDNVPVLSWIFLRGECRNCGAKISWRYPLVELLMAGLFAACYLRFGWSWTLLEILIFVFGLVTVTFIDFDHMILPDVFTLSGIGLGLVGALLNPERNFWSAFWGVLMGGGFLWAIAYIYLTWKKEEGMGGGDIKLLAWIGALLGWKAIPFVILTSTILGSVVGVVVMIQQRSGMKTAIPFGPYLAAGALLYLFGGEGLADWYLSLFLPIS